MADYAEYGRLVDASGGIDGRGGGVFGTDSGDIPARPCDAPEATVAQWQPPGPQRWEIDVSGNRVPGVVPAPGE
jgi:hypothetical protein